MNSRLERIDTHFLSLGSVYQYYIESSVKEEHKGSQQDGEEEKTDVIDG